MTRRFRLRVPAFLGSGVPPGPVRAKAPVAALVIIVLAALATLVPVVTLPPIRYAFFPARLTVRVDGREVVVAARAGTVAQALALAGIGIGPLDSVTPDPSTPAWSGPRVEITRVAEVVEQADEPIPFITRRIEDSVMAAGLSRVARRGVAGLTRVLTVKRYENGRLAEERLLSRVVLREPVDELINVGTVTVASRGGTTFHFERAIEMVATGYDPGPRSTGGKGSGYTYTGLPARHGIAAVDPRVIPLGTRLYVEGYGYALAADIGGAIKGDRIDLCFDTYEEAMRWGMRKVVVYILR